MTPGDDLSAAEGIDAENGEEFVEIVSGNDSNGVEIDWNADGDAPDGIDAMVEEERQWAVFDGEVPEVAPFDKNDHLLSCLRTRACTPENPQQLATCIAAYAHVKGREIGIVLQWVAACVVAAPQDCEVIRGCLANGDQPEPCSPLETLDRCEGSILYQCSRASSLTFAFDCANVGMSCFVGTDGRARCGLGRCRQGEFLSTCKGNIIVFCDGGVITIADCAAAGLFCVEEEGEPAKCAGGGEPCDEAEVGRSCDGELLSGCLGGRMGQVHCSEVVAGWICGPANGTMGCVPPGNECQAYPLLGSDINESCRDGCVVTCFDGYIAEICCDDYGLGECVDLGRAARCSPGW